MFYIQSRNVNFSQRWVRCWSETHATAEDAKQRAEYLNQLASELPLEFRAANAKGRPV